MRGETANWPTVTVPDLLLCDCEIRTADADTADEAAWSSELFMFHFHAVAVIGIATARLMDAINLLVLDD